MIKIHLEIEDMDYQALGSIITDNIDNQAVATIVKPLLGAMRFVSQENKDKLAAKAINMNKDKITSSIQDEAFNNGIRLTIKDIIAE